jgi:hypothetical protein
MKLVKTETVARFRTLLYEKNVSLVTQFVRLLLWNWFIFPHSRNTSQLTANQVGLFFIARRREEQKLMEERADRFFHNEATIAQIICV